MDLKQFKLILASGSPRRKDLMSLTRFPFEIRTIDVDEDFPGDLAIDEVAEYISNKKALAQKDIMSSDEIIIAADTVVVFNGKVYGKPNDESEAKSMILSLSNKHHEVYSGVSLLSVHRHHSFTCKSVVKFAEITSAEAEYYIKRDQPLDKAGSYGIQDWLGIAKVEWINGSYTNIYGLPLAQLMHQLKLFIESH